MSKHHILQNFSVSELKRNLKKLNPIMIRDFVDIYAVSELNQLGLTQITKVVKFEHLPWLVGEFWRISDDVGRVAAIAYMGPYSGGAESFALYVNDLTNGEFDQMGEE